MRRRTIAIVAAGVLVCFLRLDEPPVYDLNEAREGVYARAMLATGNVILPSTPYHEENGVTVMDRPPFFHWIAATERAVRSLLVTHTPSTGSELSTAFDEWDLRFPSALAGVITVGAVAVLGGPIVGRRAALLAAATLLASGQFVYLSHLGRIDMCLASFVTVAMLLAWRALVDGSRASLFGAAVASALAVLSKGPLGIVLPSVACMAFACWARIAHPAAPRRTLPWIGAGLAWMMVVLPWYFAAWRVGGRAFIESNLLTENLEQLAGANGRMSVFGYALPWLIDTFPWNLLAVYGAWTALRTRTRGPAFCALWWLSSLLVFEIAAYKRRAYLLPAVPAAALLAGWTLDAWVGHGSEDATSRRAVRALVPVTVGTAVVGATVGVLTTARAFAFLVAGAPVDRVDGAFAGAGVVAAVAGGAILIGCRRRRAAAVAAMLVGAVALQIGAVPVWRIARAKAAAIPALVARIERELPAGTSLTVLGLGNDPPLPLLFYAREPERWRVPPWPGTTRLDPGWYLLSEDAWAAVSGAADGPGDRGREVFRATLRERGTSADVVLVHVVASARGLSGRDRGQTQECREHPEAHRSTRGRPPDTPPCAARGQDEAEHRSRSCGAHAAQLSIVMPAERAVDSSPRRSSHGAARECRRFARAPHRPRC